MAAFYDDGTGLCFWCRNVAVADWFGVPLCQDHYDIEQQQFFHDFGVMM